MKSEKEIRQRILMYHNELLHNSGLTKKQGELLKSLIKELKWVLEED